MRRLAAVQLLVVFIPFAQAADIAAGKAKVATVCAACHGANGVSVNDTIPNLAAQKAVYIENQLKSFREGARKAPNATSPIATMTAIARQLSPADIADVAAYFASLPGAAASARSDFLPNLAKTNVTLPAANYRETFTRYHGMNFPARKEVRYFLANPVALQAAREERPLPAGSMLLAEIYAAKVDADGKPIIGDDNLYVPDKLVGYATMQSGEGWGNDIPEMLRNADWNYAVFTADRQLRPTVNQAECLACHKPLDKVSYTFTLKELTAAAKK
jgi:cytochrome c553